MLRRLGFINVEKARDWMSKIRFEKERWNGKENKSGRKCKWIGLGVELGLENKVYEAEGISEGLRKRGNQLWGGDEWNSVLVLKYGKGNELRNHVDRDVFENKVIIVNVCKSLVGFRYDGDLFWLKDGEVIEINGRKIHGVMKCNEERFSISFRKLKLKNGEEFLW